MSYLIPLSLYSCITFYLKISHGVNSILLYLSNYLEHLQRRLVIENSAIEKIQKNSCI